MAFRSRGMSIVDSSVINDTAKIHPSCCMGEFCVVEADVIIESGVVLGHHVIIQCRYHN